MVRAERPPFGFSSRFSDLSFLQVHFSFLFRFPFLDSDVAGSWPSRSALHVAGGRGPKRSVAENLNPIVGGTEDEDRGSVIVGVAVIEAASFEAFDCFHLGFRIRFHLRFSFFVFVFVAQLRSIWRNP
jgi:hypothetical protein